MLALAAAIGWGCNGCSKKANRPETSIRPTLRLYVLGGAAGAIEPCGCVKDMLGGVDHAASYLRAEQPRVLGQLVVGAGPMLFSDPVLDEERTTQAEFKAKALAESFRDMKLAAWAPGVNDWALGPEKLGELRKISGAKLLAGNLASEVPALDATHVVKVNGLNVGLAGVALSAHGKTSLPGASGFDDALAVLEKARRELDRKKVELKVALVAAPRGEALRLIERVSGFQVLVVGKPHDEGEHNDEPVAPTIVADTLVVQAPNHLQGLGTIDLFVRGGDYTFEDASGIEQGARRASLEQRIAELERRIKDWEKAGVSSSDVEARRKDLEQLRSEVAGFEADAPPTEGSYYRYQLVDVKESLGADPQVKRRLEAYYRRVNAHNKELFKDKLPPPVPEGEAGYLGAARCGACHLEEVEFWKKTPHARAYETLVKDHKQFNLECVACHVTAYEKPGGSTVTHVEGLTDVQCEVCHGPGSLHVANPADPKLIQAAPERSFCASACHHPPHVKKDWSVDRAWTKILGPGHGR